MEVDSVLGQGSRFMVRFPAARLIRMPAPGAIALHYEDTEVGRET
jgi:hypothetical protein